LTPLDILISPLKNKENLLTLSKFSDQAVLIIYKKSQVKIMTEFSEKIPNGMKMDQELPLLLMLSISEFLDTIYIILKLMLIPLFLELFLSKISKQLKELELTVSPSLMMNLITGLSVPLTDNQLMNGSVLFLKFLDYLVPKKEKEKPPLLKKSLSNLC
jgi:hypothetical protein